MPKPTYAILFSALALLALTFSSRAGEDYPPGPDSKPQDGVPKGEEIRYTFENSKIFPGTTRQVWIYVPKQYDGVTPACLHVNQDGKQFLATTVFDNLIAKKEMPVTIGVFVTPGVVKAADPEKALDRFNRCVEYDGLSDAYVRFLLEELLPDVETHKTSDGRAIKLSKNGNDRSIAGSSSGAIAAFTAAWHRPDAFQRVFTCVGTFVDQRGGNVYPALVRKMEAKPIRIFLQDGSHDGNGAGGSWFLANQEMLMALEFAGYEVNHAWGDGGHNGIHATAIFPDAMRWLWKDWPKLVSKGVNSKQIVSKIIAPGAEWELASEGHKLAECLAVNSVGEVFFADIPNNRIHKLGLDGKVTLFAENTHKANSLAFGPDGKMYAGQFDNKRIVAYDKDGKESIVTEDVDATGIVVNHGGGIYFSEPSKKQIWYIPPGGQKRVVAKAEREGPISPNGLALTPDQSLLVECDARGQLCWSHRIEKDGSLSNKQYFHYLHIQDGFPDSLAGGMTYDNNGRLYVSTRMGIQLCDQAGRHNGIISRPPGDSWLGSLIFGGKDFDELYACCSGKVYKRKTTVKGVRPYDAPFKTKPPAL